MTKSDRDRPKLIYFSIIWSDKKQLLAMRRMTNLRKTRTRRWTV